MSFGSRGHKAMWAVRFKVKGTPVVLEYYFGTYVEARYENIK